MIVVGTFLSVHAEVALPTGTEGTEAQAHTETEGVVGAQQKLPTGVKNCYLVEQSSSLLGLHWQCTLRFIHTT